MLVCQDNKTFKSNFWLLVSRDEMLVEFRQPDQISRPVRDLPKFLFSHGSCMSVNIEFAPVVLIQALKLKFSLSAMMTHFIC